MAVPAASEEDGCFPWLSKDSLEHYRDSLGDEWNYCAIIASARSSSSRGVLLERQEKGSR